ncbi:DUF3857 domain-containing protein [Mucilaginibacter terrenus]|uniref:DUF3857 domain-containing protein n=1 Tax=Mucilaginibacter terrenus TaxID=2482727 RepID=UPI001058A6B0|nr:DUF3857 domain-containing protein [Mucilaginibacter terrenus]
MKRFYLLLFLLYSSGITLYAQKAAFGQIDTADLKLTSCSFEKNASAMVLFNTAKASYTKYDGIDMEVHRRVKVFNEQGTVTANVKLQYYSGGHNEDIKNIQVISLNLVDGKIAITPLDPKLIYVQKVDKTQKQVVFTAPAVKAGSVIDIKYTWHTSLSYNFPSWLFQELIPTRYSEYQAEVKYGYSFNVIKKSTQPFVTDTAYLVKEQRLKRHVYAMSNIPGFKLEAYMGSVEDNLQGVYFKPAQSEMDWNMIGLRLLLTTDFGGQWNLPLKGEKDIINEAKVLKTDEDKIAYIFNTVKNTVRWNETDLAYSEKGIPAAWALHTGNSTEINLMLYRLLMQSGVKPTLLMLGTRDHGEIEFNNPSFDRLNKTVVRVPIDSLQYYVLDASGKYNTYNSTPYDLLGINMLTIDPDKKDFQIVKLKTALPSTEIVLVDASLNPTGKMDGSVQVASSNYKRISKLEVYDKIGEKKYLEAIKDDNNNLQLSDFKFSNLEADTLPLREDFNFKLELTGSDDNYIYFSPNLFTGIGANPFLSESRLADVDFIFPSTYSINGNYKLPVGFKIDALPKSTILSMPDQSVTFKRTTGENNGAVVIHYVIIFRKTKYTRDEYPALRQFFKTMYEMLNEQVVLKKG